jgi:hypothetical protein
MSKYQLRNKKIVTRKDILQTLDWCKKNLGKSKYFSIRKLKLRIDNYMPYLGQFDISKNIIYVNPGRHKNRIELAETIIHEYVHFLQNPKLYDRLWRVDFKDYFDHPHECEAEDVALKLGRKCLKDLRGKIS